MARDIDEVGGEGEGDNDVSDSDGDGDDAPVEVRIESKATQGTRVKEGKDGDSGKNNADKAVAD